MKDSEIELIILEQVKSKVTELSTWKQVRWEGGRLYFETNKINHEINAYDTNIKLFYFETLLKQNFIIQDNWPLEAPDITQELKSWIVRRISNLKIIQAQEKEKTSEPKVQFKKRKSIPYKIKQVLQKEINSECPFCNNNDVDHFQIHHIDENSDNNVFLNLIMLCPICHSKITKKDISFEHVVEMKRELSLNI